MLPLGLQTDIAILVMTTIARHVIGTVGIAVKKHVRMDFTIVERTLPGLKLDFLFVIQHAKRNLHHT
jgi:riboflavin synthase